MAFVFELVINFGGNRTAAEAAGEIVIAHPSLTAGQHRISLHEPWYREVRAKTASRTWSCR